MSGKTVKGIVNGPRAEGGKELFKVRYEGLGKVRAARVRRTRVRARGARRPS